jgi:hypothetical protein
MTSKKLVVCRNCQEFVCGSCLSDDAIHCVICQKLQSLRKKPMCIPIDRVGIRHSLRRTAWRQRAITSNKCDRKDCLCAVPQLIGNGDTSLSIDPVTLIESDIMFGNTRLGRTSSNGFVYTAKVKAEKSHLVAFNWRSDEALAAKFLLQVGDRQATVQAKVTN